METILIMVTVGMLNVACFLIGYKAGKKEEIKAPEVSKLNPINLYHEHKEKEAAREEADKVMKILENVERYDGTSYGQQDVR